MGYRKGSPVLNRRVVLGGYTYDCFECRTIVAMSQPFVGGSFFTCETCTAKRAFGQFFVALAQYVAEQEAARAEKVAAKKAAAREKKLASLTVTAKATFKATGAQLYAVESGEKTYHVTRIAGRVRACVDAQTGETCQARYYGGTSCCHGDAVELMEAKRAEELAIAEQVAAEVMPELADDLTAHVEDELSSQRAAHIAHIAATDPVFNLIYGTLVFGTVNVLDDIMRRSHCPERDLVTNALEILRSWDWIVIRKVARGQYWIDTPEMAYRTAYSGDFAA